MKRILTCLAALAQALPIGSARAETVDPIGDLIGQVAARVQPILATFGLRAPLHRSVRARAECGGS